MSAVWSGRTPSPAAGAGYLTARVRSRRAPYCSWRPPALASQQLHLRQHILVGPVDIHLSHVRKWPFSGVAPRTGHSGRRQVCGASLVARGSDDDRTLRERRRPGSARPLGTLRGRSPPGGLPLLDNPGALTCVVHHGLQVARNVRCGRSRVIADDGATPYPCGDGRGR